MPCHLATASPRRRDALERGQVAPEKLPTSLLVHDELDPHDAALVQDVFVLAPDELARCLDLLLSGAIAVWYRLRPFLPCALGLSHPQLARLAHSNPL